MTDTKEIIKCPACGKEMKKVYIEEHEFNLDICENCGGILFDSREFKKFDESHENIDEIMAVLENKTFEKTDESEVRICPVCNHPMVKNYASVLKEVQIDECYTCGAKFLDGGELEKIRGQYKTEQDRKDAFNSEFMKEYGDILNETSSPRKKRFIEKIILAIFNFLRK